MSDARYLLVPHPIQDATEAEMHEKAAGVVDAVVDALSR